ncbi:MAG: DUF6122 family protein [Gammaproteobacteria bacterium]|nr:DUF6122 family protein [Gammaproteobacteria bacterium]
MSVHLILHFVVPALLAGVAYPKKWLFAFMVMMSTMLVDLDHLLADPVYDPGRCSIGFHPLHGFIPIAIYGVLCFPARTRLIGLGLMIHMILDSIDCQVTNGVWFI